MQKRAGGQSTSAHKALLNVLGVGPIRIVPGPPLLARTHITIRTSQPWARVIQVYQPLTDAGSTAAAAACQGSASRPCSATCTHTRLARRTPGDDVDVPGKREHFRAEVLGVEVRPRCGEVRWRHFLIRHQLVIGISRTADGPDDPRQRPAVKRRGAITERSDVRDQPRQTIQMQERERVIFALKYGLPGAELTSSL